MPSSSSRLNIKYLENSDEKDYSSDSHSSPTRGINQTDKPKAQTHLHQKEKVDSNELSNDASNETSDSDNIPSDPSHFTQAASQSFQSQSEPANMTEKGLSELQPQANTSKDLQHTSAQSHDSALLSEDVPDNATQPEDSSAKLSRTGLQKAFFCKICNQGFTRKHNMVSHELIHTSLKLHRCEICDISFRRIHDLKRHEKLHTGEKPFQCNRCHRHFARTDALSRHLNSPNACTGNILRDQANTNTSTKTDLDTSSSSYKSGTPTSIAANTLSTETTVSAIVDRDGKNNERSSVIPLSSSNSSSLVLPSISQSNSASESTVQSSSLIVPVKKPIPNSTVGMNIQPSKDKSFPSSSLSSGSIELSQYELNKWRPLQYHEASNEDVGGNHSVNSQDAISEASSRADSSESSGGHIPLRSSTGSGRGEFPKTTTTTTTTTTMEQGNGPLSQNYMQQMALKRDEGNNRQYRNDRHYYHHIHYYHHVHNYEGQQPGQRGQYITQGSNPNNMNHMNGDIGPDRFNDRSLALRHQRAIGPDGYGQHMGHLQQNINNRPPHQRIVSDQGRGERIIRTMPIERGEHPGGVPQYLPMAPGYERQWEMLNENPKRQVNVENESAFRDQNLEHQTHPAYQSQQEGGPPLHLRLHLQLHNHEEIQRNNLSNANNNSQDHSYFIQHNSGFTNGQQKPTGKRSYVSMEKYENLMNYASNLQDSLSTLENRLVALESEQRGQNQQEGSDKRPRVRDEKEGSQN